MKSNRTYLFIAVSSVALLLLLVIQLNWILRTAAIKEGLFNERANMVLARTAGALHSDKETCEKIVACADRDSSASITVKLGKDEVHKIDSMFRYYLKFYNVHIDYSFEVAKPKFTPDRSERTISNNSYYRPLEDAASKNELELKLIFPEKKQYILAEMGTLFVTSVILILVVIVLFWRTVLSLMKQKRISEHTTDFLNNMTHEFKTPLTNIALAGKMIMKDPAGKTEDKIRHYSEIILQENEKLRLQVEQVLSMTALERGEIPFLKSEVDVHALIQESVKPISIQIENRQGNLSMNLNAARFTVMGDKTHLANALCNLIDNAVKYSGEKPKLSILTSNRDKELMVVVSDKGIGIDKQYHRKVFDKFFRVPSGDVHDVKGFGLGLSYVKRIIELHGGTIELYSEKEKGSTFTITMPYV